MDFDKQVIELTKEQTKQLKENKVVDLENGFFIALDERGYYYFGKYLDSIWEIKLND